MLKNIKEFVNLWKNEIKKRISKLEKVPTFAVIQVGNNEASNRYVKNKLKDCKEVGIEGVIFKLPEDIEFSEFMKTIVLTDKNYDAVMVQLPIPKRLEPAIQLISSRKDVDGLVKDTEFTPCTPKGIMKYLEYCEWDPTGKNVVILGRSDIVGKPLAKLMTAADATVTLAHSKTQNIEKHLLNADLVVTATGRIGAVNCWWVHCPVIDVGINFDGAGHLVGDAVNKECGEATPVPGGVGLLTRCALLENITEAAENSQIVKNYYKYGEIRKEN